MTETPNWADARTLIDHPAFASVRHVWSALPDPAWPSLDALNGFIGGEANIRNAPLRFIAAEEQLDTSAAAYELGIALRGEIPTRANWHDLFNALAWISWTKTKCAISEMHARIIEAQSEAERRQRSPARDVLTLFDESGAIILSESPAMLEAIRGFRWKEVFVERRAEWGVTTTVLLFGHALMEKMLDPHVGVTAKCVLIDRPINGLSVTELRSLADSVLSAHFMDPANIRTSRQLQPLPVLGIPGWDARNESPDFYANTDYFRPGRMRDLKGAATSDA
ncbi:MAG: DUF3025 domain-containing protein [Burkholderiales bacterium]|nr:DUF3025 domain-containing protein [Burkholderiales bacterium]